MPFFALCHFFVVQSLCSGQFFATPWTAAHQASLFFTISQSLLRLMSLKLVMSSNHLILCHPLLLLPSVFLSLSIFSNEKTLFTSGAKASALASVLPINIQGWFPLRSPILSYLTYNFSFRGRLNIFLCQQVFICRMIVNESVLVYR